MGFLGNVIVCNSPFMMFVRKVFTLVLPLLIAARVAAADEASELFARVAERYGHAKSAVIQFKEEGGTSIRGTLTTKGMDKYRLELADRTIVCDGATVWNYTPATKSVTIDKYRKTTRTLSPEFFLSRVPTNAKAALGRAPSADRRVLVLEPPHVDDWGQVRKLTMQLTFPALTLEKATVELTDGTTRAIKILAQRINTAVSDAAFTFTPPKGVEVLDLR